MPVACGGELTSLAATAPDRKTMAEPSGVIDRSRLKPKMDSRASAGAIVKRTGAVPSPFGEVLIVESTLAASAAPAIDAPTATAAIVRRVRNAGVLGAGAIVSLSTNRAIAMSLTRARTSFSRQRRSNRFTAAG